MILFEYLLLFSKGSFICLLVCCLLFDLFVCLLLYLIGLFVCLFVGWLIRLLAGSVPGWLLYLLRLLNFALIALLAD